MVPNADYAQEKVIIGVITCSKNKGRADSIRETWLKLVPPNVRALFVFGRPGEPASLEEDKLFLDCAEVYENLPKKISLFYKYCIDNFNFDYLLKIDDDSYVDVGKFLAFDKQDSDYIGLFLGMGNAGVTRTWHYGKCTDKALEVPYTGAFVCEWARGGGYILSRKAVKIAADKTSISYSSHLFEDMMVGEALTLDEGIKNLKVHYVQMGILNPMSPPNMRYVHQLLMASRNRS